MTWKPLCAPSDTENRGNNNVVFYLQRHEYQCFHPRMGTVDSVMCVTLISSVTNVSYSVCLSLRLLL